MLWISNVMIGILAVMWMACIAAAVYGAYTGLVRGEMFWPARTEAPKHLKGGAARVGGFVMMLLSIGLMLPIVIPIVRSSCPEMSRVRVTRMRQPLLNGALNP